MTNAVLLQQFYDELAKSPNFKYLSPPEQAQIKNRYANASDEELTKGIEIVRQDTVNTEKEITELNEKKKLDEEAHKKEVREKMREDIKEHEKIEKEESETRSKEILEKLMEIDTDDKKSGKDPAKKKFLGMF
jgi:hypothetical protein